MSPSSLHYEAEWLLNRYDPTSDRWATQARPEQLAPDGDWFVWLIMAGRGWGKTRTGAEWLAKQARTHPDTDFAVVARSTQDCRETCLEGPAGLLKALQLHIDSPQYNRTTGEIRLGNGAVIHAYSAEKPDRMRGPNLLAAWCDELATWRYPQAWAEGLIPTMRVRGPSPPRIVATTTPRPGGLVRDLVRRDDGSVIVTRGATFDNAANLSDRALVELRARYEGTRLGRQELYGELLEDVEGALWTLAQIDADRLTRIPDLTAVVVAIDPAGGTTEDNDETGIVVAGRDNAKHGYVLDDLSGRYTPHEWAKRAIAAYDKHQADRIVAETNFGAAMVEANLRSAGFTGRVEEVHASRGKRQRAEPVATLYEQHKVHHVGTFPKLEDQMCQWTPDSGESPDRMDALVWAVTSLIGHSHAGAFIAAAAPPCPKCGTPTLQGRPCATCGTAKEVGTHDWNPQPR